VADRVCKALRANVRSLEDERWSSTDVEGVVRTYKPLLLDLVAISPRPTIGMVAEGARSAFGADTARARLFAERMIGAIRMCRVKAKSMISGRKLSGPVISVIEALRSWKSVQVGPTAKRTLKRRRTDSSRGSGSRGPRASARAAKPQTLPSSAPPQAFAATPATQLVPEIPRTRSPPPRPPSSSRSARFYFGPVWR